ncbi:hypothetical protein HOK51_11235 [Candidatus Woesearchaeota archaeon]|jgi:hypothetical protein|nr:hypothetical protein [Candidatus Woesearchaeota archaeon]MBT6520396.1 hypothetical protein [Candidatus Woesearchaeota archaeon]MBT7368645.1 hypothetical protein [Candidatus Woesearchaeota archaeon]
MVKRGSHSKYISNICIFLIYLVITLPICGASVYGSIHNSSIKGQDNVNSYRKVDDITQIDIELDIPGDPSLDPSQIKLLNKPSKFFECLWLNTTNRFSCSLIIYELIQPGIHSYQVQIFDDAGEPMDAATNLNFVVDNLPPSIQKFDLITNESGVFANFSIMDLGCATCGPNCAGPAKANFLINYKEIGSMPLSKTNGSCLFQGLTKLEIGSSEGIIETKTICIDAFDKLGHRSETCKEITIDLKPPQLIDMNLIYGGVPIKFTKGDPLMNVELVVELFDDSVLDIESLTMDLSQINERPEYQDKYNKITTKPGMIVFDNCFNGSDYFSPNHKNNISGNINCTWNSIVFYYSQEIPPTVPFFIKDSNNLILNTTFTLPIVVDKTKPVVDAFESNLKDDIGRSWIGLEPIDFRSAIIENDSGLKNKLLVLDFTSFGEQNVTSGSPFFLRPNNCTPSWECVWKNIKIDNDDLESGDILDLRFVSPSQDDAGNPLTGQTSVAVHFDPTPPELVEGSIQKPYVCPVAGETILFEFNVSEKLSGGVNVLFDASNISLASYPSEGECEKIEGKYGMWHCSFEVDDLVSYGLSSEINVTIFDAAGNKNEFIIEQEVCETAIGAPPNCVAIYPGEIKPAQGIDRRIASQISYPIFLSPTLNVNCPNAQIQKIMILSCSIDGGFVSNQYIMNEYGNGFEFTNPLISTKVGLDGGLNESSGNSAKLSCQLDMIIKAGTKIYQVPESDNLTIDIPLYNLALGDLDETLTKKIDNVQDDIDDTEEFISDWEDGFEFLFYMCTIAEILAELVAAAQAIKVVLGAILYVLGLIFDFATTLYSKLCYIVELISLIVLSIAWTPTILGPLPDGLGDYLLNLGMWIRIVCTFTTCRIGETKGLINAAAQLGSDYDPNHKPYGNAFSNIMKYDWDPYRSEPISWATMCWPGVIYAKKKHRQLLCMKKKCYMDAAANGMPVDACDTMYNVRECVYVDGAALKYVKNHRYQAAVSKYMWAIFKEAEVWGWIHLMRWKYGDEYWCIYPNKMLDLKTDIKEIGEGGNWCKGGKDGVVNWLQSTICGVQLIILLYIDLEDWLDWSNWDWNRFDNDLGEPDFCEGVAE